MAIRDALLHEFDHEMANTRKTLERVPEDKFAWQPHAKSMTLGVLAAHVAGLPRFGAMTLATDVFDLAAAGDFGKPVPAESRAALLVSFDNNAAAARAAIAAASDEELLKTWTMRNGEQVFFTLPRIAVLRSFVMNHLIHHRAQLGVYLRLNDVPVPALYGPSADEGM